jgi:hypothetical protein
VETRNQKTESGFLKDTFYRFGGMKPEFWVCGRAKRAHTPKIRNFSRKLRESPKYLFAFIHTPGVRLRAKLESESSSEACLQSGGIHDQNCHRD